MSRAADQFADSVIAAGLLSAGEVSAILSGMPEEARPRDGEALARLLVERGTLTEFQCRELLSGSGTPLVLGDYVLLSRIGAGGMGQVFMARHRRMKRLVAVKLLPAALSGDAAMIQRFEREVEAAAKLSHPNIVQAYDAGVERGVWYLAMEYVEGSDLGCLVAREGPLPVERVVDYVRQAARGLTYAHENGVVHRDIKPANLLLDKRGTVKILDMGLARLDDAQAATGELTQTGQVMGTVDFMAPEQGLDTHTVDARADIYSLGCTLFRLLTGKNLYDAVSLTRKLMAHQTGPIPSLTAICPHAPPSLAAVFERMVAKRPEDRFQTMAEVEASLARPADAAPSSEIAPAQRDVLTGSASISQPGSITATMLAPVEPADGDGALLQTLSFASGQAGTDAVSDRSIQTVRQDATRGPAVHRPVWRGPGAFVATGIAATLLAALIAWKTLHNDERGPAQTGDSGGVVAGKRPETTRSPAVAPALDAHVNEPDSLVELLTSRDFVWTAPENLGPAVNSPDVDINPRLSDDGLRLWFLTGPNNDQIVMSRRESEDAPWELAAPIDPPLGSVKEAWDLFVSGDEKRLCLVHIRLVNGTISAVELSRSGPNDAWSPPRPLRGESERTQFPVLSADGLTLYFCTLVEGRGPHKIHVTTRPNLNAPWSPAVNIDVLNSDGLDRPAWVSPDGRALLFFSSGGMARQTQYRLWLTTRASPAGSWGPPVRFGPESDTLATDETPCLSPDGKTLIFSSDRPGSRKSDLYVSRLVAKARPPQPTSPETAHEGLDLLALVDLPRDNVMNRRFGEWAREGPTFISPGNDRQGRITVPYQPPAEYELTAVVERVTGNDGVNFGIVVDGHPAEVDIDNFVPQASGITFIDGKYANENETTFKRQVLADRIPHTIRIAVRKRSVQASVDDLKVIHWKGDPARLSLTEPIPNLQNVWFGAAYHQFKFHKLVLKPLTAAE
jgi:serine/threonine protein kinase